MPAAEAQALAVRYGGQGFGLPMTAIVDAQGHACPVWRRPCAPRMSPISTGHAARRPERAAIREARS
jgi:hypothetical protein